MSGERETVRHGVRNAGVLSALAVAALFGASTPLAKLLLDTLPHSHPHYPDIHHRHRH